ncbi:MAG: tRNA (guanosine(37)-N1)-methyltransferase TrmD [Pseudomonadota bacterium]
MWKIEILTIFPGIFESFLQTSLVSKAITRGLLSVSTTDIRDFSAPPHNKVDDSPYGGGAGMVMMVEPLVKAIEAAKVRLPSARVVLLSPGGPRFTQSKAEQLSKLDSVIFVCGRYEGIDQRVIDLVIDEELSIGDFVVMGGEVPAMLVIEACLRLRPDVIHNEESTTFESFSPGLGDGSLVEAPQYTRPEEYRGLRVPQILLSGNHKAIAEWRLEKSKLKTATLKKR